MSVVESVRHLVYMEINNTPQATGRKAEPNTGGFLFGPLRETGEAHAFR